LTGSNYLLEMFILTLTNFVNMSVIIGVRVPEKLKKELEELGIDVATEVRRFLEKRVREEKAKAALKALEEAHRGIGRILGDYAAEVVREMREGR